SAANAGKKAFIVNRIGDFGFLIGMFLLIQRFGTLNYDYIFKRVSSLPTETQSAGFLTAVGLLLFVGACGKSAQIPLFVWLPDAFFKALLFLAAGSVIHALGGEQDMRNMGGLRKQIPWTFAVMTVATLAIAGTPGLAGFFSKDQILWKAWSSPGYGHWSLWLI